VIYEDTEPDPSYFATRSYTCVCDTANPEPHQHPRLAFSVSRCLVIIDTLTSCDMWQSD